MSFAASLRKARDTSLALPQRINHLRGCVSHYHPIGYPASVDFLQTSVGGFTADSLPLAADLLSACWDAWQAELRAYAVQRRQAKWMGRRTPHPLAPNPKRPVVWHGAERDAAVHAVWFWHRNRASADVIAGMLMCIDAGEYDQMTWLYSQARSTAGRS